MIFQQIKSLIFFCTIVFLAIEYTPILIKKYMQNKYWKFKKKKKYWKLIASSQEENTF